MYKQLAYDICHLNYAVKQYVPSKNFEFLKVLFNKRYYDKCISIKFLFGTCLSGTLGKKIFSQIEINDRNVLNCGGN